MRYVNGVRKLRIRFDANHGRSKAVVNVAGNKLIELYLRVQHQIDISWEIPGAGRQIHRV